MHVATCRAIFVSINIFSAPLCISASLIELPMVSLSIFLQLNINLVTDYRMSKMRVTDAY